MHDKSSNLNLPSIERSADELLEYSLPGRRQVADQWLAGQPLLIPAVALAAGIALDSASAIPWWAAVGVFLSGGVILYIFRHKQWGGYLAVALAALAVGALRHDLAFRHWPVDHIVRYTTDAPISVRLTGVVMDAPQLQNPKVGYTSWFAQGRRTRFLLDAEQIEGISGNLATAGLVSATVYEPVLDLKQGDRVEILGNLYRPRPPDNPGERDWALMHRRNGILVGLSCNRADNVDILAGGSAGHRWLGLMRRRVRMAMLEDTYAGDVPGSRMLTALVLGQRSAVDADLSEAFVDSGTIHFLSVSGAHVGMLMSAIWLTGLALGASRRSCAAWALAAVTLYALLAEPRPSILRAALMADLFCIALLLRRPIRSVNWLAAAAIILLMVRPTQLFMPGFQMSFLSVLAIIFLMPRIYHGGREWALKLAGMDDPLLRPEMQQRINPSRVRYVGYGGLKVVWGWMSVGLAAWSVGALLSAYHFQQLALWGWLNTVLVTPLVWLTLVLGLLKTGLSFIWAQAAGALGWLLADLADSLIALVEMLSRLPGSGMPAPHLPGWLVALALAVILFYIIIPWLRISKRWLLPAVLLLVLSAGWSVMPPSRGQELRMHLLSVGNGQCCLLCLPNGNNLLCDIGAQPPYDIERWTLGPLLARERIGRIDAVILSHPNLDHYSGLVELLQRRAVDTIIVSSHFEPLGMQRGSGQKLMRLARQYHKGRWEEIQAGRRLPNTGAVEVEVLWPPSPEEYLIEETNESSLVLRITYADSSILLCGDIERVAERELLERGGLQADVLVLPHHGDVEPTTEAFIAAVDPDYCLRSSGRIDARTTNGLLELMGGRNYYNTADDGAITVTVAPDQLTVEPMRVRQTAHREPHAVRPSVHPVGPG